MTLKPLRVIAVGRLQSVFWKLAAEYYTIRIRRWRTFSETIIHSGNTSHISSQRIVIEGQRILKSLKSIDIPICLDEKGKQMTSQQFSVFLEKISENITYRPCFIIGGAFGLDKSVCEQAQHCLALSTLTFPHELARVIFFEQLYRAESLLHKTPYHH